MVSSPLVCLRETYKVQGVFSGQADLWWLKKVGHL